MRRLINAVLIVFILTVPVFSQENSKRQPNASASASASAVVVVPPRPETQFEKVSAEALDICLRIYRWYGYVEVKAVSSGNGQTVVVCYASANKGTITGVHGAKKKKTRRSSLKRIFGR